VESKPNMVKKSSIYSTLTYFGILKLSLQRDQFPSSVCVLFSCSAFCLDEHTHTFHI